MSRLSHSRGTSVLGNKWEGHTSWDIEATLTSLLFLSNEGIIVVKRTCIALWEFLIRFT